MNIVFYFDGSDNKLELKNCKHVPRTGEFVCIEDKPFRVRCVVYSYNKEGWAKGITIFLEEK